ncbi:laminin subunit beta-3 [Megalops cyprinoides]|uniref:laminin subunit beta-3 n=1 Tax=Megalops cyprinoides TaxID=118141 RepID=UPI001863D1CE|nr:laminin subunit beta-3 [Megalops cyprinoides]XP_036386199.1 laminin subunit beta-3 [Megalops cyprinoides]
MWILFQIAALAALSTAQQDCSRGACYPQPGDLLLGRDSQLHASSTCGLTGTEVFCTPLGEWRMKCCPCDSRNPNARNAHTLQNVLSTAGPDRWWQSRKNVNPVSVQLDLQHTFQLDTLVVTFKGPRPTALVIERSTDFGHTWEPALYMASDCQSTFPHVSTSLPQNLEGTYCHPLPSITTNPYLDQTIHFSPLRQFASVDTSQSRKIEALSDYTNLRVNLTQLADVSRLPGRSPSLFYAIREMQVLGSCFCHGHANRCLPDTSDNQLPYTQVNTVCECQHNTAGVNCERCADLYNDLPWRPAEEGQTHTCKRCECNNHAQSCRFDPVLFESSGRVSGGVCEGCQHHTTGPRCDRCAPNFYRNPRSTIDRPDACLRCQCNVVGAEGGAECDPDTGACRCKANVEGPHCDRCKSGYYGLSAANPLGCTKCSCNSEGSLSNSCDPVTGQCPCRPNVQGLSCDRCAPNYWNPFSPRGCEPCNCDLTNSLSQTCDQTTGQCQCRPGFGGRTCSGCPENTYGDPRRVCRPCKCERSGTASCDKRTGECQCLPGVTGSRCDSCARGHCNSYPNCPICPSCFFTLDRQIQDLTLSLERLQARASALPGTAELDLGPRIRALEASLTQIRDVLPLPVPSSSLITEALEEMRRLREQANGLNPEPFTPGQLPALIRQLADLSAQLQGLNEEYHAKRASLTNVVTSDFKGAYSTIQKAYRDSTDAVKGAEATRPVLERSEEARGDALTLQGTVQLANTRDLDSLDYRLASQPDLTPAAVQVCGSTRSTPCTPLKCDGQLCPAPGAASCVEGRSCVGALPLGNKALADTEEVKARLQELNDKITGAATQIQETQDSANHVRLTADNLANQTKQARNELESDLEDIRGFVQKLRKFLQDPTVDPSEIQKVAEGVLNTKLPLSLATLKRKIQEMRELAAGLPDSTRLLASTTPQLDLARRLLEEAQNARDTALGVKDRVDGLLGDLSSAETSVEDAESKIQESLGIVDTINSNIKETTAQLGPAQKALEGVADLTAAMRPQLDDLKALVESSGLLAEQAQDDAVAAKEKADAAAKGLEAVEDQLELLKQKAKESSGRGDGAGSPGDRVQHLQEEAGTLIQDTVDMMRRLTGVEESLQLMSDQLEQKSQRMTGLDERLLTILNDIRQRGERLAACT